MARARANGVRLIVNPGIDLQHSRQAIALAETYDEVYAAVGIHPNSSASYAPAMLDELRALAAHPKVVAIGEIGLDYYWHDATPAQQRVALRDQLALAAEAGLPVIIHNREADEDVAAELRTWVNRGLSQFAAGGAALCGRAARLRRGRGAGRGSVRLGFRVEPGRAGDVQERTRPARAGPAVAARPPDAGDGCALPDAPSAPGQAQRARLCEAGVRAIGAAGWRERGAGCGREYGFGGAVFGLEAARGVGNGIAEYTLTRRS